MKKIYIITVILLTFIGLTNCLKDEEPADVVVKTTTSQVIDDKQVGTRYGITLANIFFPKSGTVSNVKIATPLKKVYVSYNYLYVDSIKIKKTSSSYALVSYTNADKEVMCNNDIVIYKKDHTTDTLFNHLSEYKYVDEYMVYPSPLTDLFHTGYTYKIQYTQLKAYTPIALPMIGVNADMHMWQVSQWNGTHFTQIYRNYLAPTRPFDYEFSLDDKF